MHNSFTLQQYVCYVTILNMFRAVPCSSSGGTNCIITAPGIVTLCKRPYTMLVESGLQSVLNRHSVQPFTESDDTRCYNNTICSSWRWARYCSKHVEDRNV